MPEVFAEREGLLCQDGRWDDFDIVFCNSRFLSLTYNVGWYGAGAAHPNSHFETYNFALLERIYPVKLEEFFSEPTKALKVIAELTIAQLCREYWARTEEKPDESQIKWFHDGTGENFENFRSFTVNSGGITFLFPPYQVSSYAMGRWTAEISFYDLLDYLKQDGPYSFAIGQ